MTDTPDSGPYRQLTTLRAAAVAGIVFAVLFATSLVLMRLTLPSDPFTPWATRNDARITIAVLMMPFAGIAFLWFLGVVRDRLGHLEDRFFSTVVLGSGVLFLAMVFVATATAGATLALSRHSHSPHDEVISFGREFMLHISNVYGVRMAAVFMISLATIWFRTALVPRLLVLVTYLLALVLLIVVSHSLWVTLVFPSWVLVISVYLLATGRRESSHSP
ncbi:hypothetical protein [Nocardia spumae]|uniref:hypothetical protein n=1 Tax=Nocardia spumae TaxID=2887190 RepID=UPI001D15D0FD|nr:hypothetical protein [Nocardia spumae]